VIRKVVSDADVEALTRVRNAIETYEISTVEEVRRAHERDPERRSYLAELAGEEVGCAFARRSETVPGYAVVLPRVLPQARRRGVGTALLRACSA
jgi:mycothiol synthase